MRVRRDRMPAERTTMRHVREVLRLKFVGGVPTREIARRIGVAASTVAPPQKACGSELFAAAGQKSKFAAAGQKSKYMLQRRKSRVDTHAGQWAISLCFLRQPSKPITTRPVAKSRSV